MDVVDEAGRALIDGKVAEWRQGDCFVGDTWFLFRIDLEAPLTEEAAAAAEEDSDAAEEEVRGLMVATQPCDLVRGCAERPFVEVCPLVEVDPDVLDQIRRGRQPRYAYVPALEQRGLVAHLDRVMTVEKAVLASWDRTPGCSTDEEVRRLALALARKRARFAFPDDFTRLVSDLMKRLDTKHDKASAEGRALRSLREIRVQAAPSWEAPAIALTFFFIREDDAQTFEGAPWDRLLEAWLGRVPETQRYRRLGLVATLDDLTARDYVESDPLDLDRLTLRGS